MMKDLVEAIRTRRAILFVGAGVSQNLDLPGWSGLIHEMAEQLGFDPDVFEMHGDYLTLAEYYFLEHSSIGKLRSWMDRNWHPDESRVDASKVHQLIVDLDFPIIYTTNYDRWLEIAHSRRSKLFTKIANVGDFSRARDDATLIVKFHGDFEDDSSLVLTESSYYERLSFESPLDLKLRSDAIGRTLLFIGYSLTDINVRYMLYKLQRMWSDSQFAAARPKSYIFLNRPNPVQERVLATSRGVTPIVSKADDPGQGLREFLEEVLSQVRAT